MKNHNNGGRLVDTGHFVGLKFSQGWLFVHVLETEYVELKPWILLNENDNRAAIASNTAGSQDDEIVDEVGRQLIEPDDDEQNLVFQVFVGASPSKIQIFPIFGRDRRPNLTGGSEPGDPHFLFNGYDSPYNNPSEQAEFFLLDAIDSLSFQAYNPLPESTEARLSFHVNKFKYAVVEDKGLMKAFLQGQMPFRDHSVGLGAQAQDQSKAPGWLIERFGDVILTTREILNSDVPAGESGVDIPSQGGNA